MTTVCDETEPPTQRPKKQGSWWSQELAELRAATIRARRLYTRSRRNKRLEASQSQLYEDYRKARATLSEAIWRAKYEHGLVPDKPDGHPYRSKTEDEANETTSLESAKPEDHSSATASDNTHSQVETNQTSRLEQDKLEDQSCPTEPNESEPQVETN